LERGAGCLLNHDPGQNAPSRYMQCTCTVHTYHLTIRLQRVHGVVRVVPLGEICSRSDRQALQLKNYHRHHIKLLSDDQDLR